MHLCTQVMLELLAYVKIICNIVIMEFQLFGIKLRLWVVVVCILLGYLIGGMLLCSCSKVSLKEGMEILSDASVDSLGSVKAIAEDVNAKSVIQGATGLTDVDAGNLALFADNKQSPECCPSIYSGSNGCVCLSDEQANYLNSRGGNRVCPSEF